MRVAVEQFIEGTKQPVTDMDGYKPHFTYTIYYNEAMIYGQNYLSLCSCGTFLTSGQIWMLNTPVDRLIKVLVDFLPLCTMGVKIQNLFSNYV